MLDVHPPHEATHSWKDFFIHIATICVGLLIAVGLEQTVEALHHRHQHREFVEGLHQDSEKMGKDTTNAACIFAVRVAWLYNRSEQVQAALDQHHPLPAPAPNPSFDWDLPEDPTWDAARSSGLLSLFSQQDIKAYAEIDILVHNVQLAYGPYDEAHHARIIFERSYTRANDPATSTLATASPEDLHRYLDLLRTETSALARLLSWTRQSLGANIAIQRGERDLASIYAEEHRIDTGD